MKNYIKPLLISGLAGTGLFPSIASAQVRVPVVCERNANVDALIEGAVSNSWFQKSYLPYLTNAHQRLAPNGSYLTTFVRNWSGIEQKEFVNEILQGEPTGVGGANVFGISRAYATAALLADWGVGGLEAPPIEKVSGKWQYGGFVITQNHDTRYDYSRLIQSTQVDGCFDLDPDTGSRVCGNRCNPNGGFSFWAKACNDQSFGEQEFIQLRAEMADRFVGLYTSNGSKPATIEYWCEALTNASYGAVRGANVVVHENFHGVEKMGHSNCGEGNPRGAGACAYKWDDKAWTWPRIYDQLSTFTGVDSYQIDLRFACDIARQPRDWVPLAVQHVMAALAWDLGDEPVYQNIVNPRVPQQSNYGGPAPLTCGMDPSVWRTVVGTNCPGTNQRRCDSAAMCPSGVCGLDGCCQPEIVIK